jgi:thioester reductase-like protein
MTTFDRVMVSGASGTIGSVVTRDLMERYPLAEIVCILRNQRSLDRLRRVLTEAQQQRIKPLFADLVGEKPFDIDAFGSNKAQRCLAVHCAADVSWTKAERLLGPINVQGTQRFAELAVSASTEKPAFIFLSTAFIEEGKPFRNAYEKTKLEAEILLQEHFGDRLDKAIIRCSLVVGSSEDGAIPQFNGLYPLVRLVALAEVPCVIADPAYRVDTVPIDYVTAEIAQCAERLGRGAALIKTVAATGQDQAISIANLVKRILANTDSFRMTAGLGPVTPISVITNRQFRFLIRAAKSWEMAERFDQIERISSVMAGYITHGESGRAIRPGWLGSAAPAPESYIDKVIQYWLRQNSERVATNRQHVWQVGLET